MQGSGKRKEEEGGLVEVNPGLSQNPLNHSFMSASLFNETQRRFLMRKRLCEAGRRGTLESAKTGWKRMALSELGRRDKKVVLMVTVWARCHQALKIELTGFWAGKKNSSIGHACCCQLFKAALIASTLG